MTSATTSSARVRSAAVAVGLVGALAALSACSGGGSGGDGSASSPTAGASASSTSSSSTSSASPSAGAVAGAAGKLQGSWITTSGGKIVALVVTGKKAGLFETGRKAWCQGAAGEQSGMQMIHLTCPDGDKARATGMVDSVDADSMTVDWSGTTGKETYTKAEGGKLPSALPAAPKK